MPPTDQPATNPEAPIGVAYGLAAYAWWGSAVPLYIKALSAGGWRTEPMELLAQRVVFGIPVLLALLAVRGRLGELRAALASRRMLATLAGSAALLSTNWFAFIWAVGNDRLMDSSLGYYLNPLVSVVLGAVFLGERARRWQLLAFGMCVAAVAFLTVRRGELPWVAVTVALSFGFYGLVRKRAPVRPVPGLCVEMLVLLPLVLGVYAALAANGVAGIGEGPPPRTALMLLGGVMTILPLVWFAAAAGRLRLATVGMLQYLAPTGQFLLALAFGEPLDAGALAAFALIWSALAIYSADAIAQQRRRRRLSRPGGP